MPSSPSKVLEMEDVKRLPRQKPPTDIDRRVIEEATVAQGVVDLSKVRELKRKRKEDRMDRAAKAVKTRRHKAEVAKFFLDVYKEYFGGEYELRPKRFVRYTRDGVNYLKRYKPDTARIYDAWTYVNTQYQSTEDEFTDYMRYAMNKIADKDVDKRTKVLGLVISESMMDEYYLKLRKKRTYKKRKVGVSNRKKSQAKIFEEDE